MLSPLDEVETRLFRRGVSDQEVRQAVELVREHIRSPASVGMDEADWWHSFGLIFDDLTRNFAPAQLAAFEIAVDTLLVHAGMSTWTVMRHQPASTLRAA
ncbi:hypothetical protein ARC20_06185 [Stenotrophomonas panacihumi]|uniref:Uncharacterized protein n=1 Tax=Stenotrophomonas panacihumi TaxID=676599 RepID=A0A0R0AYQ8_9GAMM|nr:hypothetical protein [Stenotrophomonas panacihumi]KRG45992.1 hypothetical protein ARC20_06185 [Stenotrophomonas panacihumi]PTN56359.1 hypothetical protein C9J98_01175 [Stenotrophomonas panacihumi]